MKYVGYKWAESKLLPCPFCGGAGRILPQKPDIGFAAENFKKWLVRCMECLASVVVYTNYQRQVIATWNRRPKA